MSEKEIKDRILEIMKAHHKECSVEFDFSLNKLGWQGRFMNISVFIHKDNVPKLFIMIIGKTTPSHREYLRSINEIKERNYNVIAFKKYLPIKDDYIVDRLHYYL